MSYIEELRKSKNSPVVAYSEFVLSTRKFPKYLFCFFEGKDNPYYISRIKGFTENYQVIRCGNKKSVIDVYNLIQNRPEYTQYKLGFFIDRDFNKPIGEPKIFETPYYSIENFYVSIKVFREVLVNEFHLSEASDILFQELLNLYTERQTEFHNAVLLFNSWYCCLIEKRDNENITTGVSLGEKFPKDFINISLESVSSNYDLQKIKEKYPDAIEIG